MSFPDPSNEGFIEYGHLDDNIEYYQGDYISDEIDNSINDNMNDSINDTIDAKLEALDNEVEHTINNDALELANYEQHDSASDLKDALFDSEDENDNSHHDDDDDIDM
jgi:hypothetical protein